MKIVFVREVTCTSMYLCAYMYSFYLYIWFVFKQMSVVHICLALPYLYADVENQFPCWIRRKFLEGCCHNLCSVPGDDGTKRRKQTVKLPCIDKMCFSNTQNNRMSKLEKNKIQTDKKSCVIYLFS